MSDKEDKLEQRRKNKRNRQEEKRWIQSQIDIQQTLRTRCQQQLDQALLKIDHYDISMKEFSSDEFDCRICPMFMQCSLAQLFTEHPKGWVFLWQIEGGTNKDEKRNKRRPK